MCKPSLLLIVSGPSGVGKGSVCQGFIRRDSSVVYSVSATTRNPRPGEIDGVNYHFLDREDFLIRRDQGQFLEWAEVYGNFYGTLASDIKELLNSGKSVILEIDTQGAMQVKSACPEAVSIFIMPPSMDTLRQRIFERGTEDEAAVALRLSSAESEIAASDNYDYRIVNDDLQQAIDNMQHIVSMERSKRKEEMC